MTTVMKFSETVRRSVCFAMAAGIVALGLTFGDMLAAAAYADAYAHATTTHVSIVQLASL